MERLDIRVGLTIPVSSGSNLLCFSCGGVAATTNNEIIIRQGSPDPACELGVAFEHTSAIRRGGRLGL